MKFLLAFLVLLPFGAAAHEITAGDLEIIHPSIPAPPPGARAAAAYVGISNDGTTPERLIGVEIDGVGSAMLHASTTDANGMVGMTMLDGIDIPPGETVVLQPGEMHLMLTGLTATFKTDDMVPGALIFEHAGRVEVEFMVVAPGEAGEDMGDMEGMDHSKHGG